MRRRSSTYAKACRVLGVSASVPVEDIARRYRALAMQVHPDTRPDDPEAAARMVELNGAWSRIKFETRKRRTRFAGMSIAPEPTFVACAWPHPPSVRSRAFEGCELRPTEGARCYRVMRSGQLLLTLHRHPDDASLLFARNNDGRIVRVNHISWWTDREGEILPLQ
jgi:hypothetical protein